MESDHPFYKIDSLYQYKMSVKNIESLEEFKGAITGDKLVVVDFTASWQVNNFAFLNLIIVFLMRLMLHKFMVVWGVQKVFLSYLLQCPISLVSSSRGGITGADPVSTSSPYTTKWQSE